MEEGYALAMKLQTIFEDKLREEVASLVEAFGPVTKAMRNRAATTALRYMQKTYPDVFFDTTVVTVWDGMTVIEKMAWWWARWFLFRDRERYKMVLDSHNYRNISPPIWAIPEPKKEEFVILNVGIAKSNISRRNYG